MSISKQKFREMVFQLLYSQNMSKAHEEDMIPFMMREFLVPRKKVMEAQAHKESVLTRLEEIDVLIKSATENYAFERITGVELNVLRLGLFELLTAQLPPLVAISESVRLSRKFGGPEGASYVNAVLDKICKEKGILNESNIEVPAGEAS